MSIVPVFGTMLSAVFVLNDLRMSGWRQIFVGRFCFWHQLQLFFRLFYNASRFFAIKANFQTHLLD